MVVARPSNTNSAMITPTMGESLKPWPLNPVQMYRPSIPSTRSITGWESGVLVYKPGVPGTVLGFFHQWNPANETAPRILDKMLRRALCENFRVFDDFFGVAVAQQGQIGAFGPEVDHVDDVSAAGMVGYLVQRPFQQDDLVAGGFQRQVDAVLQQEAAAPRPGGHNRDGSFYPFLGCGNGDYLPGGRNFHSHSGSLQLYSRAPNSLALLA